MPPLARAARIETRSSFRPRKSACHRPQGRRGLKRLAAITIVPQDRSPLTRVAWIETVWMTANTVELLVAARRSGVD